MKAMWVTLASIASAGVLIAARPACAEASARLLPARSEIDFVSKQMGVPVDGRFKRFEAQLAFDPKAPSAGHVTIKVDLSSVDIGADAEGELAKPGWFDSKRHPDAVFTSTSIRARAPGQLDVAGKLTIKGIARDAVVPVTLTQAGGVTQASGGFVIKRLDYQIGAGDWDDPSLVANEVQVNFKLAFAGIGPL